MRSSKCGWSDKKGNNYLLYLFDLTKDAVHALCVRFGVVCVFLPPYSYDFNPIETSFHEGKQFIRRTWGLVDDVIAERLFAGLTSITAEHAVNYYEHCGYMITAEDRQWAAGL